MISHPSGRGQCGVAVGKGWNDVALAVTVGNCAELKWRVCHYNKAHRHSLMSPKNKPAISHTMLRPTETSADIAVDMVSQDCIAAFKITRV